MKNFERDIMPTLDLSTLPACIQQALLDLYEFLQQKHANKFVNPMVPASEQQLGQADFIQNLYDEYT